MDCQNKALKNCASLPSYFFWSTNRTDTCICSRKSHTGVGKEARVYSLNSQYGLQLQVLSPLCWMVPITWKVLWVLLFLEFGCCSFYLWLLMMVTDFKISCAVVGFFLVFFVFFGVVFFLCLWLWGFLLVVFFFQEHFTSSLFSVNTGSTSTDLYLCCSHSWCLLVWCGAFTACDKTFRFCCLKYCVCTKNNPSMESEFWGWFLWTELITV